MVNISELERTFVGSILLDPNKLAITHLRPNDFVLDTAKRAFIEISKLWSEKKKVDVFELHKAGIDLKWLSDVSDMGSPARVKYLSEEISKQSQRRRILNRLEQIKIESEFCDNKIILSDILTLYNIENVENIRDSSINSVMRRYEKFQQENRKRGCLGVDTGFNFFRDKYIQYVPGHVWAVGGYTSVGKSASMIEMLSRLPDDARSCIISTEMTQEQIMGRIISRETGFHSQVLLSGSLCDDRLEDEENAKKKTLKKKLDIFEDIYFLDDIVSVIRRKSLQGGVDVVWIDYIQNCKVRGAKSEYESMGMIAKTMQRIAKDLRCTIILLSQIGNAAAKQDSGLLEFKGAGDIAAVADLGIWLLKNPDDDRKILWDYRKNRHGRTGKQVFQFIEGWTRLVEIDSVKNK